VRMPLGKPVLGTEEKEALLRVIDSGYIASGQIVKIFEDALAKKFQRKYCIVVNSGTSALYLSLKVLGISKVIVPSMTCINVLNAILNAGMKPIFADVEDETHNIDLSTLSKDQLDEADGLIVTHAYGHSADMDILESYVRDYHLILIEDFAQATGGYFKGRILGSFGGVSVTSFYDTKSLTTGHGGAIFTDDSEVYQKCLYARGERINEYYRNIIPMNLKMSDIQAVVGQVQLERLDSMVEMKRNIARKFTNLLADLEVGLPYEKPDVKHTYYKYHLVLPEYMPKQDFIKEMHRNDISAGICFDPPLHKSWLARDVLHADINLPVAESIATRTVSLPIFPALNDSDISRICEVVTSILKDYNKSFLVKPSMALKD
jgi:perosamine synthetase